MVFSQSKNQLNNYFLTFGGKFTCGRFGIFLALILLIIRSAKRITCTFTTEKEKAYTKQCTKKICIIFALPFFTCMVRFFFCYISGLFYQGGPPVIMVRIFFSVWTKLIYNPILLNKRLYSHTVLLFTLVLHEKIHLSFNV